jgi:hypothetical protein
MNEEILVPIVAMLSICTTLFALYYLRNKENMALIEKGINPRQNPAQAEPSSFQSLRYGLLFAGGGLGLLIAFLIDREIRHVWFEKYPYVDETGARLERTLRHTEDIPELYFALIILGAGLGLVMAYVIRRRMENK